MRTNIELDHELLAEAQAVGGTRTKRETVHLALAERVRRRSRRAMLDVLGSICAGGLRVIGRSTS